MQLWAYGAIFISLLLTAVLLGTVLGRMRTKEEFTYTKIPLFSRSGRAVFKMLELVTGTRFRILTHVHACDVLQPQPGMPRSAWKRARERICTQRIMFLLCNPQTWDPVCGLELVEEGEREPSPALVNACETAGLPLVLVPAAEASPEFLRDRLARALGHFPGQDPQETRLCPECGAPMIRKRTPKGGTMGREFWGCTKYPECKAVLPIRE
ncbi:MAG: DUF2726 domain-containing protein [Desulfovibrionales bacterium]